MGIIATQREWNEHPDPRRLLATVTEFGLPRDTLAAILSPIESRLSTTRERETLTERAHRLRRRAAHARTGEERRALYARYAATCAMLLARQEEERLAGAYAAAALSYAGVTDPGVVRSVVAWEDVQELIDGSALTRAEARREQAEDEEETPPREPREDTRR